MKKMMLGVFLLMVAWAGLPGGAVAASANAIDLDSPEWLGNYKLDQKQLAAVKAAMERAMTAPIDVEQQCAEDPGLCVVRAAREWFFEGIRYRAIVIYLHTIGNATGVVRQIDGKWTEIKIKEPVASSAGSTATGTKKQRAVSTKTRR
ncbi:MAG: hypothetical protein IDH49_05685 [Gammaproteobacteria bacterium]|nr:hypothetical protein [Gammaproteobacteria bacterium]